MKTSSMIVKIDINLCFILCRCLFLRLSWILYVMIWICTTTFREGGVFNVMYYVSICIF